MATSTTFHDAATRSPVDPEAMVRQPETIDPTVEGLGETDDENLASDDGDDDEDELSSEADADSLIGISIGPAQESMKSPTTPAATKAQALEASRSYFGADLEGQNNIFQIPLDKEPTSDDEPPILRQSEVTSDPVPKAEPRRISPSQTSLVRESQMRQEKKSSLVSSILSSVGNSTRQRSSSASSMMENFRKRLPDMPSMSMPKFSYSPFFGTNNAADATLGPAGPGFVTRETKIPDAETSHRLTASNGTLPGNDRIASPQAHPLSRVSGSKDDASVRSMSRPEALRRTTSDQSLYLRKGPTGAADFDDYTAFAAQSEMVNSRFKAISDSFQDSAFRRPRMPNLGRGNGIPGNVGSSKQTGFDTKANAGPMQQPRAREDRASSQNPQSSKHPLLKGALARLRGDLVIMGGYRGSILREADPPHRQLWVPIKVGMNLRKADLEVGLTRGDEIKMEDKIIADGVLSHIGPVDIGRRLIKKCRGCPNVQSRKLRFHDHGYDWRLSPDLLSDRLIRFLESLRCNRPDRPVNERGAWVIAHSLGGVLTRHVINRRPDLIAGVVYAGTPQNCVNILGPLRNGDDVLFSSRVLTAQVNFTLRTSFALLPQEGRCFINKDTGERYDVDFFNAKTWDEYRLSPCISSPYRRYKPEKRMGMMESISEAISQPTKHFSWFSSVDNNSKEASTSMKDKANDAMDEMGEAADAAMPNGSLNPSMDDGSSRHNKPSIATQSTIPLPVAKEYLTRTLSEVLKFKQETSHNPILQERNAYPPAAVLFAKNTPTVYGAFVKSREDIKYEDAFDDLAFAAGDGVVLASAAQLPTGYRCVKDGRVESERGHVGLLGDLEGVGRCLNAIIDARQRGVGVGAISEHDQPGSSQANAGKSNSKGKPSR